MEIAEGTSADLRRACELWFDADEGPAADDAKRRSDVQQLVDGLLDVWQRPPVHLLLATVGSTLVGTVFGKPLRQDATTGQVSMLAVLPSAQRQGIGKQLLGAALTALAADGCTRCQMYVAADDDQTQQFYERRGWVFSGHVEASPDTGAEERIYLKDPIT